MRILSRLALTLLSSILLISCSIGGEVSEGDGVLLNRPGVYKIERLGYLIKIEIIENSIVKYTVFNDKDTVVLESVERFSNGQRWCLFWDSKDKLWVISSDIGNSVWQKSGMEGYKETLMVDNQSLIKEMPDEVFNYLPKSEQKNLSIQKFKDKKSH